MSSQPAPADLVIQGITAFRAGDKPRAFDLLVQALKHNSHNELAWLWLSAVVIGKGEQKYCLERVVEINPQHAAARQGLKTFGSDVLAQAPFTTEPAHVPMGVCTFQGCGKPVSRPGHTLCYEHWKLSRHPAPSAQTATAPNLITASILADHFGITSWRFNLLLAELGWIEKDHEGWTPTEQGRAVGGVRRVHPQSGVPFVVWPETIQQHKALMIALHSGGEEAPSSTHDTQFRDRFPAQHRTTDGHWVRSKAEVLIDNWLYMSGIVHAYERQLPVEEEAYCDFYIPQGKVYIEYWGLEQDAAYVARRKIKQELYEKYHFKLIELTDEHIRNLDDYMPKLLLKFGISIV